MLLVSCDNKPLSKELIFSKESGFYDDEFLLNISCDVKGEIFYTLDGSDPSRNSLRYENGIEVKDRTNRDNIISSVKNISSIDQYFPDHKVDKCTILKAVCYYDDDTISDIYSKTYFVGLTNKDDYQNIPTISLYLDKESLFNYDYGIYTLGKYYDELPHVGYPETYPANYQQKGKDWERKATIDFFNEDKTYSFNQDIGIRIHGGWTWAFNQKSFNLYARKEYGSKKFKKRFFDDLESKNLMLRSGGYRDSLVTKTRDSLFMELNKNENFDIQQSIPCSLFLNGEYWGIYNLQERFTDNYIEGHYGIDSNNVIIIENDLIDEGSQEDIELYNELKMFFTNNEFLDIDSIEDVKKVIDIDSFISYMGSELYVGNIDWPANNVRLWRARKKGDKNKEDTLWRFMAYDTDDSMNMLSYKCSYDIDPFLPSSHWKSGPLEEDCILGLMFSKLMKNEIFEQKFLKYVQKLENEIFSPEKVSNYIYSRKQVLSKPLLAYYKRFVSNNGDIYNQNYIDTEFEKIIDFFNNRAVYFNDFVSLHF